MKAKIYFCTMLILIFSLVFAGCSKVSTEETTESATTNDIVLVTVNNEQILKSEIDPVYKEYSDTTVSYDKIIEDTIDEILIIQQAPKYNILISESEINDSIEFYKATFPEYYNELYKTYTENEIRKKIHDRLLFSSVRNYVLKNITPIDHQLIEKFKKETGLQKQLQGYSDAQIIKRLEPKLQNYAIKQWILELRNNATIIYNKSPIC